jgi:hypothetical protein
VTEPISLSDLRRKSALVPIDGGEQGLRVQGLSAREICDHLERFPPLATMSIGGNLSPADALKATPGAIAAWIASACGNHNDSEAEKSAEENLTAEDQSYVITESLKLTFSRGFGPFVTRLGALMEHLTVAPSRGQGTRSPTPPPPAAHPSTTESGNSPPAS